MPYHFCSGSTSELSGLDVNQIVILRISQAEHDCDKTIDSNLESRFFEHFPNHCIFVCLSVLESTTRKEIVELPALTMLSLDKRDLVTVYDYRRRSRSLLHSHERYHITAWNGDKDIGAELMTSHVRCACSVADGNITTSSSRSRPSTSW